jgi:hypothetical protein
MDDCPYMSEAATMKEFSRREVPEANLLAEERNE